MACSGAVQVKLELGHRAQVRKKPTAEGFTHDWMVFVRGPENCNIQHFVEKVVFHLHESFPKPKRVCKDPPYKVEESGYAGFILPIEVYFKNKEEPKKVRFDYDLFLHVEGHPPVNHLRCEKLTFNNPVEDFGRKLLKAGGVMVMQEDSTSLFGQHIKLPTLSSRTLTLSSEPKRSKDIQGSKDGSKGTGITHLNPVTTSIKNSSHSKLHKPLNDHKEKPPKNPKESESAFRDCGWETSKATKETSRKPKENQPVKDISPKLGFKEPKTFSKDIRTEGVIQGSNKRSSTSDISDHLTLKRKKMYGDSLRKATSGSDTHHLGRKLCKDRTQMRPSKLRQDSEEAELQKSSMLPPIQQLRTSNDSDGEDQSAKSDSEQPSPGSTSSNSSFASTPFKRQVLGPLQSVIPDLHSDDNGNESEDEGHGMDSDTDRPAHTHLTHHHRRVSLSDGSESDSSSHSTHSHNQAPPLIKTTNTQILDVKSPTKQDKNKKLECDKAYLEELVELHKRLMTLREGHILQQIVNLIEETGHFHITNTTFDFDLCSLDRSTVKKLQSYLDTSSRS
ncbi:protein AF-9 isoform X2 [Gouania willdenowi]|uniref:YEATS domain-containing protein n=1 Tax=Gouania willdenowi TaxID=441366 RepID=A0A8C5EJ17_GOUWI|nr:protein AF-9 isoform X2 [Gouania willdenowi]